MSSGLVGAGEAPAHGEACEPWCSHAHGIIFGNRDMSKPPSADSSYQWLCSAHGQVEANLIQSVLEAADIRVLTFSESAGAVYGFTVGALGRVDLWVPGEHLAEARAILAGLIPPEGGGHLA